VRTAVEQWVEEPLLHFIAEARVRLALLLDTSGRVLGQHGFARSVDVMSACALAAAIHASGAELGRQLDGVPFTSLHHAGLTRQLFIGHVPTPRGSHVLVAVFDDGSSIGLVRLYFGELCTRLGAVQAEPAPLGPALRDDFESDLNRNLARLFGRA
jgi:hypothetical protein